MPVSPKAKPKPWIVKVEQKHSHNNRIRHSGDFKYDSHRWRLVRKSYITRHPLCEKCKVLGRFIPAKVVDHIIPIKKGGAPWSESNFQSMCHPCHNAKSAKDR